MRTEGLSDPDLRKFEQLTKYQTISLIFATSGIGPSATYELLIGALRINKVYSEQNKYHLCRRYCKSLCIEYLNQEVLISIKIPLHTLHRLKITRQNFQRKKVKEFVFLPSFHADRKGAVTSLFFFFLTNHHNEH